LTAEHPFVTVNILAYNRREALRTSLREILDLDYPAQRLEVIVVDNASSDGTAEMLQRDFPSVRVVRMDDNVGVSGWNRGFALGRGDYFLVLDDDCYISGGDLSRAITAAQEDRADLVSFRVKSSEVDDYYFDEDEYRAGMLGFWGCSALISRDAVEALGGFDPRIFLWPHELEFTMRLLDRGFRHTFLPEVTSVHMKAPLEFSLDRYRTHFRNFAYTATKLMQWRDLVPALGHMCLDVLLGAARHGIGVLGALVDVLSGVRAGLAVRRPVRPIVSRAYRDNYLVFVNPVQFLRRPTERFKIGGGQPDSPRHFETWFGRRERFFPRERATIEFGHAGAGRRGDRTPAGVGPSRSASEA